MKTKKKARLSPVDRAMALACVQKGLRGGRVEAASHLRPMLHHRTRAQLVNRMVKRLKKVAHKFDTIACCGLSGVMFAVEVARRLKKDLLVVRKGEQRHSEHAVEGVAEPGRFIVIDDLCETGASLRFIINQVKHYRNHFMTEFVGCDFYIWEVGSHEGAFYSDEYFYGRKFDFRVPNLYNGIEGSHV